MERKRYDGEASLNGGGSAARPPLPLRQPNYTCTQVQGALRHLASIDPIELCDEAKIERCRATRDLRSCGRYVESVLITCKHASLCEECSQLCDVCPICRIPLSKEGVPKLSLRLYYECLEAGLISKTSDQRFPDEVVPDVQRLYSLFDVALENNLTSLICHYVTDVCMDETAVSSDPVVAFLLDEVVVKDWCKLTFRNLLSQLQAIYNLTASEMQGSLDSLWKYSVKLGGILNVVEVLESSFKDTLSAKLHDLHYLQESILKTKQHMEIMIWCIRHEYMEKVKSQHADIATWRSMVRQRKSDAVKRAWPDFTNRGSESSMQQSATLFIEDALLNLETETEHDDGEEYQIESLHKHGESSFMRSKLDGMSACYPFENLRAAIDILFLQGTCDLVVAKQGIFLYYLFDRHWSTPDENWRWIIDDFAATFGISRHALLESLTFYLLDDLRDVALQEASGLLREISGVKIHPKIGQVLLERQNPDGALMVVRWSGKDGGGGGEEVVSLEEAITGVRVRVECGLLTEAFMYQRMIISNSTNSKDKDELNWVEMLVNEICILCIRSNLVDRMIELPWNSDEEKHIHKCLLDFATDDPSKAFGSLLVVFYLQRYRYSEAYEVESKLEKVEEEFISKACPSEEVLSKMRCIINWRAGIVGKGIELLPDVLSQKVKSGVLLSSKEDESVNEAEKKCERESNSLRSFFIPPPDPIMDSSSSSSQWTPLPLPLPISSKSKMKMSPTPTPTPSTTRSLLYSKTPSVSVRKVPFQLKKNSPNTPTTVSVKYPTPIPIPIPTHDDKMDISWSNEEEKKQEEDHRPRWRSDDINNNNNNNNLTEQVPPHKRRTSTRIRRNRF